MLLCSTLILVGILDLAARTHPALCADEPLTDEEFTRPPILKEHNPADAEDAPEHIGSDESRGPHVSPGGAFSSNLASARLMKELMDVYKSDGYKRHDYEVELVDDNLFEWQVKLFFNYADSKLHEDLKDYKAQGLGEDHIMLRFSYGQDYPNSPPFVRVVYPRLWSLYSIDGGALCLSIFYEHDWSPSYGSGFLFAAIMEFFAKGQVRIIRGPSLSWTEQDARRGVKQIEEVHDWSQPDGRRKPF